MAFSQLFGTDLLMTTPISNGCNSCDKEESDPEIKLKTCAKCKKVRYCCKQCQKKDWQKHKKFCSMVSGMIDLGLGDCLTFKTVDKKEDVESAFGFTATKNLSPIDNPTQRLKDGTFLHDRPEKDAYKLLVDTYRYRVEEEYVMTGDVDEDSLYGGNSSGIKGFKRFMRLAEKRPNFLPDWWSPAKRAECFKFAMEDEWSCVKYAVEKSDIREHYGGHMFPVVLTCLAEHVYGTNVQGEVIESKIWDAGCGD